MNILGIPLTDVKSSDWNYTGIYKITNILNGACYIGQSINIRTRITEHLNKSRYEKGKLYNAIRRFGVQYFEVSVVVIINTFGKNSNEIKQELNAQECFYISLYNSYMHGYNATLGGDSGRLGFKHSKETIEKIKQAHKNYTPKAAIDKMKTVYCYDLLNKVVIYANSMSEASFKTGSDHGSISQICRNHNFKNGGRIICKKRYIFAFTKEELEQKVNHYMKKYDRFQ